METKTCILPFLNELTTDQINKLNENSFLVKQKKREYLFNQDKPVSHLIYLNSGLIKIFKQNERKKSVILAIIGPGNFIGLSTSFYGKIHQYSAETIEDSELVYINLVTFYEILSTNGAVALQLFNRFSKEAINLVDLHANFLDRQIPGRIAKVLLLFASQIYYKDQYILPLNRQELADMAFTTKESVSRTLTEFKNDRIIDLDDRKISLLSKDLLEVLSRIG